MSKILIGIIGNDAARFHEFTASMLMMRRPENTDLQILIGGDWCGARNDLAQLCLDGGYSHLWFMDDDHSFAPDLLERLIAWGKPLVTPVCLQRVFPFAPVEYVAAPPELQHLGDFVPIDLANHPGGGLVEIEAGGAAGMLIAREVLVATDARNIPDVTKADGGGWFEYGDLSEDVLFCEKAKAAGFTLYADLGARLGHITTCVVIPSYTDEHGWTTGLRIGKDYDIRVKQTYDLIEDGRREREPAAVSAIVEVEPPEEEDDYYYIDGDEVFGAGEEAAVAALPSPPIPDVPSDADVGVEPTSGAERIEIWMDAENMWWWRALDHDGVIITQDSAINEATVVAAAVTSYPGASVHHIQREVDDSRNPQQYGPPTRLWNRGAQ